MPIYEYLCKKCDKSFTLTMSISEHEKKTVQCPDCKKCLLIDRNDLPKHLFGIPDLDLSDDLCAERLAGPWFRLGACSTGSGRDKQGVENVVYRQSMLLSPEDFSVIFDKVESIVGDIGKPGGSLIGDGDKRVYRYSPFHRFEMH